jgi:hypothetical protein
VNYAGIVSLAQGAGLTSDHAKIAAAIAMAESGGSPSVITHDSDDDSYGLWQINMKGDMGPARRKQLGISANSALLDPKTNARAMAMISGNGANFGAWATFTGGQYKKFLQTGSSNSVADWLKRVLPGGDKAAAIGNQAGENLGTVVDSAQATAQAAGAAVDTLQKSAAWLSKSENWLRIAYVAGGGAIILAALYQLMSGTAAGKALKSGAKKAATVATSTASKAATVAAAG